MRLVVGLVLVLSASASAGPRVALAPGLTEPASIEDTAPAPPTVGPLDHAAQTDAASDRGFFVSTALALRPGQFDMSLRSAIKTGAVLSVAAGLGRGIELSIDGSKMGSVGKTLGVGMKLELARHSTWSIAATGSVHALYPEGSSDSNHMFVATMRLTTCTGGDCNAMFTFGGGFGTVSNGYSDVSDTITPALDASFIIGKSWCRPLLEVSILDGELGYLGLRFGGRHVAFDTGVGAILGDSQLRHSDLLALVGLSVRP